MVDQRVYNYLKQYLGQYDLESLKQKLIDSGYTKEIVDEAANALKSPGGGAATIQNKKAMTKKQKKAQSLAQKTSQTQKTQQALPQMPKKSNKLVWILLAILLLLIGGAIAAYFLDYLKLPF